MYQKQLSALDFKTLENKQAYFNWSCRSDNVLNKRVVCTNACICVKIPKVNWNIWF